MLLTVKDLAPHLQLDETTLYAWAKQGKIPCRSFNGTVRFDPGDIERWLEASRNTSPTQLPRILSSGTPTDLDTLIARAKRQVYTSSCGKPDQDRATAKEGNDGSV